MQGRPGLALTAASHPPPPPSPREQTTEDALGDIGRTEAGAGGGEGGDAAAAAPGAAAAAAAGGSDAAEGGGGGGGGGPPAADGADDGAAEDAAGATDDAVPRLTSARLFMQSVEFLALATLTALVLSLSFADVVLFGYKCLAVEPPTVEELLSGKYKDLELTLADLESVCEARLRPEYERLLERTAFTVRWQTAEAAAADGVASWAFDNPRDDHIIDMTPPGGSPYRPPVRTVYRVAAGAPDTAAAGGASHEMFYENEVEKATLKAIAERDEAARARAARRAKGEDDDAAAPAPARAAGGAHAPLARREPRDPPFPRSLEAMGGVMPVVSDASGAPLNRAAVIAAAAATHVSFVQAFAPTTWTVVTWAHMYAVSLVRKLCVALSPVRSVTPTFLVTVGVNVGLAVDGLVASSGSIGTYAVTTVKALVTHVFSPATGRSPSRYRAFWGAFSRVFIGAAAFVVPTMLCLTGVLYASIVYARGALVMVEAGEQPTLGATMPFLDWRATAGLASATASAYFDKTWVTDGYITLSLYIQALLQLRLVVSATAFAREHVQRVLARGSTAPPYYQSFYVRWTINGKTCVEKVDANFYVLLAGRGYSVIEGTHWTGLSRGGRSALNVASAEVVRDW